MLIRGDKLNEKQRRLVLAAFVHRWTFENAHQTYGGSCPACVQHYQCEPDTSKTINGIPWHKYHTPLKTDEQFLAEHAFHFTRDGSRLMANRHSCEPAFMAERQESNVS